MKEALRDRLVCGLKSEAIQKKLLSERDLDFDGAVRIATAMETAEKDTLSFAGNTEPVYYMKSGPGRPKSPSRRGNPPATSYKKPCFRCGEKHNPDTCKFKNSKCFKCGATGHVAKKCKSQPSATTKRAEKPTYGV